MMTKIYQSISPSDNSLLAEFDTITNNQLEKAIQDSQKAFKTLTKTPLKDRQKLLVDLGEKIRHHAKDIATIISSEMGKPISQSKGEVEKCIHMCLYHAKHAPEMLQSKTVKDPQASYTIHQEPLGPVLFISTWNNPFLQATLAIVPQLVAGNSVLIKPAHNTTQCVLKMAEIIAKLDIDKNIYIPVLTNIEQAESLLKDLRLKGVTFIGSTKVGRRVASLAAESFKAAVIDAGGSDPFVVLDDADIDKAVTCAVAGRFSNTGQSCVAAKRIIVHKECYDMFLSKFTEATKALNIGHALDEKSTVGPLSQTRFRDEIKEMIDKSVEMGASIILGGNIPNKPGAYLEPTIITNVTVEMPLAQEEVFGPVAVIFKVQSQEEALKLANSTPYGLGASLFTKKHHHLAKDIETGNVAINRTVSTTFPVPFGGIKQSGFGVYFGVEGVQTFTNSKVVSQGL